MDQKPQRSWAEVTTSIVRQWIFTEPFLQDINVLKYIHGNILFILGDFARRIDSHTNLISTLKQQSAVTISTLQNEISSLKEHIKEVEFQCRKLEEDLIDETVTNLEFIQENDTLKRKLETLTKENKRIKACPYNLRSRCKDL